jgi:hypothetical protein
MKRVLLLLSPAFGFAAPATFAQSDDHIQAGLYADYFRLPGGAHHNLRVAFGPYIRF